MNQIEEAIQSIDKEIDELQKRKQFLESVDINQILSEDEWHEMCQSYLRNSDILSVFITNMFPDAKDINVGPNYVKFSLYNINCYLPTSLVRGIEIDTKWFIKSKKPIYMDSSTTYIPIKLKHFNEYINATNWDDKSKLICGNYYKKWYRFILWHFKYKFKHKEYLEKQKELQEDYDKRFNKLVEQHEEIVRNQKEVIGVIKHKVIPELSKFTDRIRIYKPHITYSSIDTLDELLSYYDEN